jgi:phosphate transport system substrate-binding protein
MIRNTLAFSLIALLLLSNTQYLNAQTKLKGRITLSGAFALYPMAVKWADEFKKLHPEVTIDISAGGARKGITDALAGMVDLGMVSREIYPEETRNGAYPLAVAKDAVVPIVNEANPLIQDLLKKGLKKDAGNHIWITGQYKSWNQVVKTSSTVPIRIYTRSDACGAAEVWAKYFGKKQEDLLGSGVFGDPGLTLAVKNDPLGIGFNNIGYAYDHTTKKQIKGIRVLPLDINDNGIIDPEENFYDNMDQVIDAIANGKYPSPPARELFFVTKSKPTSQVVKEFLRWILTDGQKYVRETGYIALPNEKLAAELKKL